MSQKKTKQIQTQTHTRPHTCPHTHTHTHTRNSTHSAKILEGHGLVVEILDPGLHDIPWGFNVECKSMAKEREATSCPGQRAQVPVDPPLSDKVSGVVHGNLCGNHSANTLGRCQHRLVGKAILEALHKLGPGLGHGRRHVVHLKAFQCLHRWQFFCLLVCSLRVWYAQTQRRKRKRRINDETNPVEYLG